MRNRKRTSTGLCTYVFLGILLAAVPNTAMALSYTLSSTTWINYLGVWSGDPQTQGAATYDVKGMLEIGNPLLINMGPELINGEDRYKVAYPIGYSFEIEGRTLAGNGGMIVDAHGCGLFDCNFSAPLTNTTGTWTVNDGAFFYSDGALYPNAELHSLSYAEPPARIEFYGADISNTASGYRYHFVSPLIATRVEGVSEPSTAILLGGGLLSALFLSRRRAAGASQKI